MRARRGEQKVTLAWRDMPGLRALADAARSGIPFSDIDVLGCVTVTPETGALVLTLTAMGARVRWCSDNRFASDDDVVAYLNAEGIPVFARANMSLTEYYASMDKAMRFPGRKERLVHLIDDGADLTSYLAEIEPAYFHRVRGVTEQTTCGLAQIRRLYARHRLPLPTININDCFTKKYFDNYYGVQQSLVHGLAAATGMQLAGKAIAVFGYGPVGRGAASILRSIGARVVVVECDLLRLVQAHFDGFGAVDPYAAVTTADLCITATGCVGVISPDLLEAAADGLILCNIGHGTLEYDVEYLRRVAAPREVNDRLQAFRLPSGKTVYSLCDGALVNVIAGRGNPPAIMSLTFTLQILGQLEFLRHPDDYREWRVHDLPRRVEVECAELNYPSLAQRLYRLRPDQLEYLDTYGTDQPPPAHLARPLPERG